MQIPQPTYERTAMRTFLTAIATLLLAAAGVAPLSAQLSVTVEGANDPSVIGDTVVFDSDGLGQRVAKRVYLNFDPGLGRELTLRTVRVRGSQEFTYEIADVTRFPILIRNELQLEMFLFYLPTSPGPAEAVIELTLRLDGSGQDPSDTVYSVNVVGRVPAYSLSYALPGMAPRPVSVEGQVDFGNRGIGQPTEATLVLANIGSGPGNLRGIRLSGSTAYRMVSPPSVPTRIEAGRAVSIQLAFQPPSTNSYSGQLTFDFGGLNRRYHLAGVGGDLLQYSFSPLYLDGATGPATRLQSGTTIAIGHGDAGVELTGANIRQGAQLVESISVTGPFSITDAPSLPASLQPRESLSVHVVPRASDAGEYTGALLIGDAYFPLSFELPELSGISFGQDGGEVDPTAQVPVTLSIDQPYPYDISGVVSLEFVPREFESDPSVQWSAGGRQIAFEIASGSTAATFATGAGEVSFQASRISGEVVATATVRADHWGLDLTPEEAPEVRYSVTVPEAPSVVFSSAGGPVDPASEVPLGVSIDRAYPVDVTGVLSVEFVPRDFEPDPGVQWATGGRQIAFEIASGSTAATFGGGATEVSFRAAKATGDVVVTASLLASDWGLNLTEDSAPEVRFSVDVPELPAVSFSRSGETVGPAEQIPLGVSIAQPYPTDIIGALNLSFESRAVVTDPSVQWVTGGRSVPFWIPRGSTSAVFSSDSDANPFQTGTVAGEIVVTANLVSINEAVPRTIEQAMRLDTAIDVTPDTLPEARFNVMESAPVIQRVALGQTGQGTFSVLITGYATSRQVDTLSFAFTGTAGSDLRTPSLDAAVTENFRTYFGGNQSTSFGSQFTATVQFSLDEGVFEDLNNVSVTAGNGSGTSNAVSLGLN